jgi:hypothetical protein
LVRRSEGLIIPEITRFSLKSKNNSFAPKPRSDLYIQLFIFFIFILNIKFLFFKKKKKKKKRERKKYHRFYYMFVLLKGWYWHKNFYFSLHKHIFAIIFPTLHIAHKVKIIPSQHLRTWNSIMHSSVPPPPLQDKLS